MTLYETIFARRSVRKYDVAALDAAALDEIKAYTESATQLSGQSARFEIVSADKLKGGLSPYAILAFSDGSDAAFVNIGYTLQDLDLWLQSRGLGSVWCGMAKPLNPAPDYRILLGFGGTSEPLRKGESDFKRKKLSDISNADNAIARTARIAPSAVNFQPWKLDFAAGAVTVHANVRGVGKIIPGRLYLFDLGIITKHVEVALEHEGKTITAIEIHGNGKDSSVEVRYE
ncbi:nitroreductase [Clostridia bacterium]|nr:nitroreductase [Clostridia bacterium]